MSWGRLDDRLDDNPKFAGIDPAAAGLWLLCQPQALRRGDGFVPQGVPERFTKRAAPRLVAILVARGLWDIVDGGWAFHDFTEYAAVSQKRSEAGSKGAASRWQRDGKPMAKDASRDGYPEPEPVPVVAKATPPPEVPHELVGFVGAWNAACSPLPRLRKPPQGEMKRRLVRQALAYFDGDLELLGAAVRRMAADRFIADGKFGFETFCRHPERWEAPDSPSPTGHLDGHGLPIQSNPAVEAFAASLRNTRSLDNPPEDLYPSGPSERVTEERECVTEADHPEGGGRVGPLAADIGALAARWQDPGGTQRAGALDPQPGQHPPLADRGRPAQVTAAVGAG